MTQCVGEEMLPNKVKESTTPGFLSNEGEIRINITDADFSVLVEGRELVKVVRGRDGREVNVRLMVSRVSFSRMIQAIRAAMRNLIP
jgi:hypothetical protein